MFDLTVGQISGVIAAAVFILQLVIPNAIPLVIAGTLKDEHNVVTWGVAQREIARSLWPTLICADSVATQMVDGKVKALSWVRLSGADRHFDCSHCNTTWSIRPGRSVQQPYFGSF